MNFIAEGVDICDAVLKVSRAISARGANPILEGVKITARFDQVVFVATDLEIAIEKKIKADVKIDGEAVVPGKFFADFARKISNERVEIEVGEQNTMNIKYAGNESQIQCLACEEFPTFKKIDSGDFFSITKSNFKQLIKKTVFAVAVDDSRPILKGVLLEANNGKITSAALDGYRLALTTKPLIENTTTQKAVVPAKSLHEIASLLDDSDEEVRVFLQKNYLMVDLESVKIITRLFEGEFLSFKQIIAKEFATSITISKEQLETSLERASLITRVGQNNLVKLEISSNNLLISSNGEIGKIEEMVKVDQTGNDLTIAFNARYFLEALKATGDEMIKIKFNTANNPCVITPVDEESDEYLFLVLPVRMIS